MSTTLTVRGITVDDLLDLHRRTFGDLRMEGDGADSGGKDGKDGDDGNPQTFTQADVDRIVADRLKRERDAARAKYADYDQLKAKAAGAKTLEDRVAGLEKAGAEAEARALRAEVANDKGLTPGQAKRLVGATREELEADADQLLKDIGAQGSTGNRSRNEGRTPKKGDADGMREFARNLFGGSD